jgi:hypothetical protein
MHVGSRMAVCSPNPEMGGGSWNPNKLQRKLYQIWSECRDQCPNPDILVLNGEPCDGPNQKQYAADSWSSVIREQLDDAAKLLKMYKTDKFLMTRGSGYHVQLGADNQEEILAKELNAIPYSGYLNREESKIRDYDKNRNVTIRTDNYLTFKVYGKVFSVTHHIGFNRWFAYRTTALAREMADMEFLGGRYWKNEDKPSVIVRSHVHYFVMVRFATQFGFTTPAFKLPDTHLFKGGLGGTAPSLGTVQVIVESNGHILIEPHIVSNEAYPKHNILDLTN